MRPPSRSPLAPHLSRRCLTDLPFLTLPHSQPNGSALAATQRRYADLRSSLVAADITPSPGPLFLPTTPTTAAAFLNANLTTRPVFFGCSADPTPSERDVSVPLVISIPNYPWSAWSNTSTLQLEYDDQQAAEVFANGESYLPGPPSSRAEALTRPYSPLLLPVRATGIRTLTLNGTLGLDYAQCLACALADRAVVRAGNARSALCTDCFATWCVAPLTRSLSDSLAADALQPLASVDANWQVLVDPAQRHAPLGRRNRAHPRHRPALHPGPQRLGRPSARRVRGRRRRTRAVGPAVCLSARGPDRLLVLPYSPSVILDDPHMPPSPLPPRRLLRPNQLYHPYQRTPRAPLTTPHLHAPASSRARARPLLSDDCPLHSRLRALSEPRAERGRSEAHVGL